jgi:WD40 repeat protein
LAWSEDGTRLASGGDDRAARIWNVAAGKLQTTLPDRPGKILSLVFCGPNRLAAGSTDNLIRVWDLAADKESCRLSGHTGSVAALVWDPTPAMLVSGGFDTTVRLWSMRAQETPVTARRVN